MIFGQEMIDKILAGEKIVTRRPVKFLDGPTRDWMQVPCRYKPGRTYAVQPRIEEGPGKGRGGKSVGRIKICYVNQEALGRIDGAEAKLEGFKTRTGFQEYWRNVHGRRDSTQLVHRIEFELLEHEDSGGTHG